MSKPRNKTRQRRLHYMGIMAAAGLLTIGGAAGPLMAASYSNTTPIDGSNLPTDGADIVGGPVIWNADPGNGGTDTIGGTGLHYTVSSIVAITEGTAANTAGITVDDGKTAELTNTANAAIKSTGAINTGTGSLTVNVGTGSFTNTGQTMSGTVILNNATATLTNTGKLAGVDLTLGGDATIEGVTDSTNTLRGAGTVTNNSDLTQGSLILNDAIVVTGSGGVSGTATIIADDGTSFSTTGAVSGGTLTGQGSGSLTLSGGVSAGNIETAGGGISISNSGGTGLSGGTVKTDTGAVTVNNGMSGGSVEVTGAGSVVITGGLTGGSVKADSTATTKTVDSVNATDDDVSLTGITVTGNVTGDAGKTITANNSTLNKITGGQVDLTEGSKATTVSGGAVSLANSTIDLLEAGDIKVVGNSGNNIGKVTGTSSIYGSTGDGTDKVTITDKIEAPTGDMTVNIGTAPDSTTKSVTVAVDEIVGGGTNKVTVNVSGEGSALTGNTGTSVDLSGKVEANVKNGGKATFGNIDGAADDITLNANGGGSTIKTGDIKNEATVNITAKEGGKVTTENITDKAQVTANADGAGSGITIGNVEGDGTKLVANATDSGTIAITDIKDKAVVDATGTGGGKVTIKNVDDATLIKSGDVKVTGNLSNVGMAIDKDTTTTWSSEDGAYTGSNYVYAIDKANGKIPYNEADPNDHRVVIDGAIIGGDSPTQVTFGANEHPTSTGYDQNSLGAVKVTDTANGGTINGRGGTTINIAGNTVFELANTIVKNGTTTINIDNTAAKATIGGQENGSIIASTDKSGGATLVNAGNVVGNSSIGKNGTGDITYKITDHDNDGTGGSIGGGSGSTNFTINDGVNVEAKNINGTGGETTITINADSKFTQETGGAISGAVNLASNTAKETNLGQLQNDAALTYGGAGTGETTVASTANDANASVTNNNSSGTLKVAGTGDNSNVTYRGNGSTTIMDTGNNATSTVDGGRVTIKDSGLNGATVAKNGGQAILDSSIGQNHSLEIEDGEVLIDNGFSAGNNLASVKLDSTKGGDSKLTNNISALNLANGISATVGSDNVVVKNNGGLGFSKDVEVTGKGSGAFKVAGAALDLNNNNLKVGGSANFDFTEATGGTGFSEVNALNSMADGTKVDFVDNKGYLDVKTANVDHTMVYGSDLSVGGSGTADNTIYADTVNVNKTLAVEGAVNLAGGLMDVKKGSGGLYAGDKLNLTSGTMKVGDTVQVAGALNIAKDIDLRFDANADYAKGGTAILAGGSVSIAQGSKFSVDNLNNLAPGTEAVSFTVIDGNKFDQKQLANLGYAGGNSGYDSGGNAYFYDWSTGDFDYITSKGVTAAVGRTPGFAKRYVTALMNKNAGLAYTLGTEATNEEIVMAMGNTLNAALMMNNNPLDPIMKNLNTLHPQTQNALAKSAGECEAYGAWITPNFSYRSIDGNYAKGYGAADIKSYGVTIGGDAWVDERLRVGGFFAINSGELDGDFQKIDSDDFQLGVYAQALLDQGIMLNVGMAYGWQSYDADRKVYIAGRPNASQRLKSDFDGNTFSFMAEVNKTFALDYGMYARPSLSYTYLGTELDSYREKSRNLVGSAAGWNLAQRVSGTDFNLHLIRLGTDIGWTNENSAVVARVYYVGNAGDDQPENTARFIQAPIGTPSFKVIGAEYDDHMANLGLTLKVAPTVNTHVAIDYDALLGSNSETHNVNLSFKYEW